MAVIVIYWTSSSNSLSLHDALPIYGRRTGCLRSGVCHGIHRGAAAGLRHRSGRTRRAALRRAASASSARPRVARSEEHTSELQSRENLVCRLLLEKKNLVMVFFCQT